jgi:hypothetical protein
VILGVVKIRGESKLFQRLKLTGLLRSYKDSRKSLF